MDAKDSKPAHSEEVYTTPQKQGGIVNKLYPPGPDGKGRVKNHCRKFWWCDLLVIVIIALIIVLPIIYVAIPNIAQDEINKSTLEVTSQDVSNTTPDQIHLKLDSVIKSSSKYHPTIDGFRASLSLEGQSKPFLYINIPSAKSEAVTSVTVDQDVKIEDAAAFADYTKTVMGSETFQVRLDGKPKIHLGGLPSMDVNYNKVVTMKGLNRLKGLNITSIKIITNPSEMPADGSNMVGTVFIPNPSVQTLELGNLTMNLSVDGKPIGNSTLPNLTLKPGENNVPMQAHVDQGTVLTLITSKYKNAILPLDIVGNSSVRNGQHLVYFEEAIKSNTIRVDLNVGPALAAMGLKFGNSTTS